VYWREIVKVLPVSVGVVIAALVVMLVEIPVVGWKNSSLAALIRPSKSATNDLFWYCISLSGIGFILWYVFTLNVFVEVRPVIRQVLGLDTTLLRKIPVPGLQLFLFVIMIDFVSYVFHYAMHFTRPLWAFHKVHHSATEFNAITSERAHLVETSFVAEIFFFLPFAIVGTPVINVTIYVVLRHFVALLHHSRLPWSYGWFGTYVIASPQYHRIHHSVLPQHRNKNLAIIFPIWDHLFGTYCGDRIELNQLGVDDNHYNKKSLINDFFLSFILKSCASRSLGMQGHPPDNEWIEAADRQAVSRPIRNNVS
jgi:sterol desaturase/sphingolipid hydroxylase (fatty acid hydroxylase superfamily)